MKTVNCQIYSLSKMNENLPVISAWITIITQSRQMLGNYIFSFLFTIIEFKFVDLINVCLLLIHKQVNIVLQVRVYYTVYIWYIISGITSKLTCFQAWLITDFYWCVTVRVFHISFFLFFTFNSGKR